MSKGDRPISDTSRDVLTVVNWSRWQTYRTDRDPPPWIKIHRNLPQNPEWVMLDDRLRGQLIAIWILAASKNGTIEAPAGRLPEFIQLAASMSDKPDLETLETMGFVTVTPSRRRDGASVTPSRRSPDAAEAETEAKAETEADTRTPCEGDTGTSHSRGTARDPPAAADDEFVFRDAGDPRTWE